MKEIIIRVRIDDGGKVIDMKTEEISKETTYTGDQYARIYDWECPNWVKDAKYNLEFIKMQQQYANDLLNRQGYLFLNDVYRMLGFSVTKAGQIVGWIRGGYVDFGIFNNEEKMKDIINGYYDDYETSILLNFNVDGNILDLI